MIHPGMNTQLRKQNQEVDGAGKGWGLLLPGLREVLDMLCINCCWYA